MKLQTSLQAITMMKMIGIYNMSTVIKYKLMEGAKAPFRKHSNDAGFDLYALSVEHLGNDVYKYHLGISFEMPYGIWGDVRPRSSVYKTGLILCNSCGVIDTCYRGEVCVIFHHVNKALPIYKEGDRVCQIIFQNVLPEDVELREVDSLSDTSRSSNGFGSTGVN